jgi:hypothetical protein
MLMVICALAVGTKAKDASKVVVPARSRLRIANLCNTFLTCRICYPPELPLLIKSYISSISPWLADNWSIQTVFRKTRLITCKGGRPMNVE